MIISHSHRFTFISTMKCATNSLTHLLLTKYDGTMPGELHDRRRELIPPGHFTFSVCRNPYTRAISVWWSTCMRHDLDRYGFRKACPEADSFEGFMAWVVSQPRPPHDLLITQSDWHRDTPIEVFLHVENLEAEFARLPFVPAPEKLGLLNATVTSDQHTVDFQRLREGAVAESLGSRPQRRRERAEVYLTPQAVGLVRRWAEEDFARFGYDLDPAKVHDISAD